MTEIPKSPRELEAWLRDQIALTRAVERDLRLLLREVRKDMPRLRGPRPGLGPRPATIARRQALYQEWLDLGRPTLDAFGQRHGFSRERARQILSHSPDYQIDKLAMRRS